jgi:hypothetical protein
MAFAFPDSLKAYREYVVVLPAGERVTLAFTLGDLNTTAVGAAYARQQHALAYGLILISGLPGAPDHPLIWIQDEREVAIAGVEGDQGISAALRIVISRLIASFFVELASLVPGLAERCTLYALKPANDLAL